MELKQNLSNEYTLSTKKGNEIRYKYINSDLLRYYKVSENPTKIIIHCNFNLNTKMADLLEESQIIKVAELDIKNSRIVLNPCPQFSFITLADVFFDLLQKFEL